MQRKIMPAIVPVITSALHLTSLCLLFSLKPANVSAATPKTITQFTSPVVTATSSTSTTLQPASGIDPLIIAALIGLAGVIIGALIAGAFAVYQMRRNARIQLVIERYRKELEAQYKAKEQEEQREETKAETLRLKMLHAQTNAERAKAYRQSVHADPRISRLQILDMNRPLEVTSIYVRVRVHQDVRPGYVIDKALLAAEAERDPNALLQAGFKQLESRVSSAIDPDEAIRKYKRCVFVTARKAGYQQRAQLIGFTELEVLDFRLEEMQQFVTNWFDCYEDPQKRANAADLNTKLQRNPRIQALAANPLLLSLIVLVYEAQLDLPDRRAEMYKECVDTLLTKWDAKRNIRRRREFKPEHKRQLLAELDWHFHLQGRRYFPESEVLAVIADFLPKVRLLPEQNGQVLAEIANEQGLLKEQARGWQGFLHLTLQEYFVAQYVTDHHQLDALFPHCGDPWWEEVILLYAGYTPDASPILRNLIGQYDQGQQQQDDLFQTNLILAGRCLAARPTIQQVSLWETIINRLFESLTKTPYSLSREHMAETLAAVGSTEVNTRLLQMLSDEQLDSYVRSDIARSLTKLANDEESVRIMATLLLTSDIADNIHRALWTASHRAGVRIFIIEGALGEKQVEIVKL